LSGLIFLSCKNRSAEEFSFHSPEGSVVAQLGAEPILSSQLSWNDQVNAFVLEYRLYQIKRRAILERAAELLKTKDGQQTNLTGKLKLERLAKHNFQIKIAPPQALEWQQTIPAPQANLDQVIPTFSLENDIIVFDNPQASTCQETLAMLEGLMQNPLVLKNHKKIFYWWVDENDAAASNLRMMGSASPKVPGLMSCDPLNSEKLSVLKSVCDGNTRSQSWKQVAQQIEQCQNHALPVWQSAEVLNANYYLSQQGVNHLPATKISQKMVFGPIDPQDLDSVFDFQIL